MATTKEIAVMLRKMANRLEADYGETQEVLSTLTMLGFQGSDAVFPIEEVRSRKDAETGLVIVDFVCPKPAGDFIRAAMMAECGELITMAAKRDLENQREQFKKNIAQGVKENGVTIH